MTGRWSIRVQLTAAMVVIAVAATGLSMFIANFGLHDHLDSMAAGAQSTTSMSDSSEVAAAIDRQHAMAGGVAVLFALSVALLLGRRLSAPLVKLSDAADRLAAGDLRVEVPRSGPAEVRKLAEDFDRLRLALAREDRLRRQGFAELAHELRTPVTNIRARLEAAQDDVIPIERGLPVMCAEVERISRLLDELSMLADLDNPTTERQCQVVDLADIVRRQASMAEARVEKRDLRLELHAEVPVRASGEPHRLEQVVCNLLSNAIAYSLPGGTVTLSVAREGDAAVITVADEGIGIESEDLPYVTRRFWRGRTARKQAGDGAGVGLAVVDEIVRTHEGELVLSSALGRGTIARVLLPIEPMN